MTAHPLTAVLDRFEIPADAGAGPITRRLLGRSGLIYLAVLLVAAAPWALDAPDAWKAFGAGLAFPGAGFLTAWSWTSAFALIALLLSAIAFVAWFWAGMVIAVPTVWLGAAVIAALVVDGPRPAGYATALTLVALAGLGLWLDSPRRSRKQQRRRAERNQLIAAEVPVVEEIRSRAAALHNDAPELSPDQVAALRYSVDLAHQAFDDWTGFDRLDIFQPAAVRYQLNQLGWGIAIAQSAYTPNLHGYLSVAQRNLIERYLQPEVLGYWKYERMWGHLRWSADPVGRDNIMLTGYYGLNLALYAGNTGDLRYHREDALPFRVSKRRSYPHHADDIRDSLLDNYARYRDDLCLYPCEPNWAYSGCNFRGGATLAAYDRLQGTSHWPDLRDHFLAKFNAEFTAPDGAVVALRSTLTGLQVPFPMPDSVLPKELNPIFPDLASRYWALVRSEILRRADGGWEADLPGVNLDFGNYTKSDLFSLGGLYGSAKEMGDEEVATSMLALIDATEESAPGPALWFPKRSTLFNATLVMDRLLQPNGWHDAINVPASPEALTGPVLSAVDYPAVLVLRARSDGRGLSAVLTPGDGPVRSTLEIGRLTPGAPYQSSTGVDVVADAEGNARVEVDLEARTEWTLTPLD